MDFVNTESIMYCNKCKKYIVIDIDEQNLKDYNCVRCQSRLIEVLDN